MKKQRKVFAIQARRCRFARDWRRSRFEMYGCRTYTTQRREEKKGGKGSEKLGGRAARSSSVGRAAEKKGLICP